MAEPIEAAKRQGPKLSHFRVVRAAGIAIIASSAAAALLPAGNFEDGPQIVGSLMIFVGLVETAANALRRDARWAVAAGLASLAAGGLILGQSATSFLTTVYVVIGWLLLRGLLLLMSAFAAPRRTRPVTAGVAVLDLLLAGIVWTGLTASSLVIALFGPTALVIAKFAWVMAISFAGAGLLLVRVDCEEGIS